MEDDAGMIFVIAVGAVLGCVIGMVIEHAGSNDNPSSSAATVPCKVGPGGCLTVGTGVVIPHTCDLPLLHLDAEHQRYVEAARLRWKPNLQSYAIEPASGWFVTADVSDADTDFNAVRLSRHGLEE